MSLMPPGAIKDHRRMKRRPAKHSIAVICRKGTLGLGPNLAIKLRDISVDGAQLFVKSSLNLGDDVELTFSAQGFPDPLVCEATVMWCSSIEGNGYRIGVKFADSLDYEDVYHMT